MNKQSLRIHLKKQLTSYLENSENKKIADQKLLNSLISHPKVRNSKNIAIFAGAPKLMEVDTLPIINHLMDHKKHNIFLPKVLDKTHMDFYQVKSLDDKHLVKGKFGILEPIISSQINNNNTSVLNESCDIMIVPGLGFDDTPGKNYRLGRGGGFYDRYFEAYQNKFDKLPYLLGIGYKIQRCSNIPVDRFDVEMNEIILV